jgi:hypothetical protein
MLGKSPANFRDLIGLTFWCLTVVRRAPNRKKQTCALWECRCSCGGTTIVRTVDLVYGHTKSCGCLRARVMRSIGEQRTTHGATGTAEHRIWSGIKQRCENPSFRGYKNYGGRGIKICSRWRDSLENFLADMGKRPSARHSIDRIDTNGDYEPDNCRWATMSQQARNRRNNRVLEFAGKRATLTEFALEYGISKITLKDRLNRGWSLDRALTVIPGTVRRWTPKT